MSLENNLTNFDPPWKKLHNQTVMLVCNRVLFSWRSKVQHSKDGNCTQRTSNCQWSVGWKNLIPCLLCDVSRKKYKFDRSTHYCIYRILVEQWMNLWFLCLSMVVGLQKDLTVKSSFSEKATKIWKKFALVLTVLSENNCFVKTGGRFFQFFLPSLNVWTLHIQAVYLSLLLTSHNCSQVMYFWH